ncbi:hypothetical protein EIP86_002708 [Pleurotus ostreatoroseus]|nr:hypothetical protein EIP86_002708 [Pleurotus ostreatoroseus]
MAAQPKSRATRQSGATYDALVEKATAKGEALNPTVSPTPTVRPLEPDALSNDGLDPLWEKVWNMKAKALEALPSKVRSLDVSGGDALQKEGGGKIGIEEVIASKNSGWPGAHKGNSAQDNKHPRLKRKSRQDMHVSYRNNWIVITWRRVKVSEKVEDGVLVRERKEKQYCQSIPMPEGACFEDVRASRDGHWLMITYPNSKCIRIESRSSRSGRISGETSTTACSEEEDFQTCKLAPSTMEMLEVERL